VVLLNKKIIFIITVICLYFFINFSLVFSQVCNSCSPPSCTLTCNAAPTYRNEIPIGNNEYFSFTVPAIRDVSVTMTPDSTADYDLYTKWTALTCPTLTDTDCGFGFGSYGEPEGCGAKLSAGTYYVMVNHYDGAGGYNLKLDCLTTTTSTSTTSTSTSTTIPKNYLQINGTTFTQPQAINITGWSDDLSKTTYIYKNASSKNPDFLMQKGIGKQYNISLSSAWNAVWWNISVNSTDNATLEWRTFQVISTSTSTTSTSTTPTTSTSTTSTSTTSTSTIPCNVCPPNPSCTLTCNAAPTYRSEIPIGGSDSFSFTIPGTRDVSVTMTPDPNADYDLMTKWTIQTCPNYDNTDCGSGYGTYGQSEGCGARLSAGTYYINVTHYALDGPGGYTVELDCLTTTSTTSTSTTSTTSTSTTSITSTSTTAPTTTSTTTTIPVCGDKQINPPEQCDIGILLPDDPDNACKSYEYCNSTCKCHDFRPEMLGCNLFDWCTGSCTWNIDCYSETAQTDPSYKSIIEGLCQDASRRNHTWRQECKV